MAELSLNLLGPFEATLDGIPHTHFRTKSVQALLIYLACQPDQAHRREVLMTLLWPGLPQESARANLRQSLYLLRKALPKATADSGESLPFIVADRQTVRVNPQTKYELDVLTFRRLLRERIDRWPEAVALYKGDFLCDFYLPDSAPFEEWSLSWRQGLQQQALDALATLVDRAIHSGDFDTAAQFARRQLAIDNLREPAHLQLIKALALDSRRTEAASHYEQFAQILRDDTLTRSPRS